MPSAKLLNAAVMYDGVHYRTMRAKPRIESLPTRQIAAEIREIHNDRPDSHGFPGAVPYSPGHGRRVPLNRTDGRGYCDYVPITDDLLVNICNRHSAEDIGFNFVSEGFIKFHYRISGISDILLPNGETVRMHGPICGVLAQPEGEPKGEICRRDEAERWMTVLCSRRFFSEQIRISPEALPPELRSFTVDRRPDRYHAVLPLAAPMIVAVNDLLTSELAGDFRSVFIEGKVLELISMTLSQISGNDSLGGVRRATQREREQLQHAMSIVAANLAEPKMLSSVARNVGLNPNRLNRLLRDAVDMTYTQYVVDRRMREAHKYLRAGDLSITEIAYKLGYDYAGNFSAAFRRFFGVPPKAYLRNQNTE